MRTPEYIAYIDAKKRCNNRKCPRWKDYGGRGIKFLFTSFQQFIAELGPRPKGKSLDREDNNKHYEPGNVRWASRSEQQRNQRLRSKPENNTSGHVGVHKRKDNGRYQALIIFKGKRIHLGTYTTFQAATIARKAAENNFQGEMN